MNRTRSLGRARTKDQWPSKRLDYGLIFHEMEVGFAIHEMIFDAEGRPLDYRFLDANPAYERITGLRVADIRGKRVREVLPGIEERWIETYGRVALTGEHIQFEDYAVALDKHFAVVAFSPQPRQFAVLFTDITARKDTEAALR